MQYSIDEVAAAATYQEATHQPQGPAAARVGVLEPVARLLECAEVPQQPVGRWPSPDPHTEVATEVLANRIQHKESLPDFKNPQAPQPPLIPRAVQYCTIPVDLVPRGSVGTEDTGVSSQVAQSKHTASEVDKGQGTSPRGAVGFGGR